MAFVMITVSAIALSACAGGPDRRPQKPGAERMSPVGQTGPVAKPIALFLTGLDANSDYLVDAAEFQNGLDREWRKLEQFGPVRAIEFDEWARSALGTAGALPSFGSFDRNLDGVISHGEFDAQLRQEFNGLDKNNDGFLERPELIFNGAGPRRP